MQLPAIFALLGQIGDGESLAPGIAHKLLERRAEIEALFVEHDAMMADAAKSNVTEIGGKIAQLPTRPAS